MYFILVTAPTRLSGCRLPLPISRSVAEATEPAVTAKEAAGFGHLEASQLLIEIILIWG